MSKKIYSLLICLVIGIFTVFIVSSCSDESPTNVTVDPDKGSVTGKVVTTDSQEGIENALVRLSAQSFTTQETYTEKGEFQFSNLDHGEYQLTVRLPQGFSENDELERQVTVNGNKNIQIRANPVRVQTSTIQKGTKDTVATSSGSYLTIDASNADTDIEVHIEEISDESYALSGALTKPVRIRIGSESGTTGAKMINMKSSSTGNTSTIQLSQFHDGNPDDVMFMFNLGTDEEHFYTYADGVPNMYFQSETQSETQVIEHEFSLIADDNISFDFSLKELDRSCPNSFRSLDRYDNILEGSKPLILIHGIQLGLSTCEEFLNFDPKTELFDPLIHQLQQDDAIRQNYALYVYKYTSHTSVVHNSEALWEMMSELDIEEPVIIAHSMGGLVARDLIIHAGEEAVAGLITLGTLHEGTPVANLVFDRSLSYETACADYTFTYEFCLMSRILTNFAPRTDGLRDLRTDSNLIFNLKSNESTPDKVFTVGGTLDNSFDWSTYFSRIRSIEAVGSQAVYEIGYEYMGGESSPNDGLVPFESATPEWSGLRAELMNFNHSEIARGKNNNASSVFEAIRPVLLQLVSAISVPQLATKEVTDITSTSAVSGGHISNDGGAEITERGVCWSESDSPTIDDNCTSDGVGVGEFESTITDLTPETEYFVRAYATNEQGTGYGEERNFTTEAETDSGEWQRDTETEVVDVTNPATGQTWMDRNLGASRAATSMDDEESYGDLYQWGRPADGHQKRNSGTTSTLSSSDQPGHGDFILTDSSPYDWRNPQNDNLWQGVDGVNNPCPDGYRVPTEAEWEAEIQSWSNTISFDAFESHLKLPVAGLRLPGPDPLLGVGFSGSYWSSTVTGKHSLRLDLADGGSNLAWSGRAVGNSVRCIKD